MEHPSAGRHVWNWFEYFGVDATGTEEHLVLVSADRLELKVSSISVIDYSKRYLASKMSKFPATEQGRHQGCTIGF